MFKNINYLFLLLVAFYSKIPHAEEIVHFVEGQEIQIRIPLIPNIDKKVIFDEPVAIGVTQSFKDVVRVQSLGSSVYFTAKKASERTYRISAKGQKSQRIYVLAVTITTSEKDNESIRVISGQSRRTAVTEIFGTSKKDVTPVELIRFVSQTLFSPKYAIEPVNGVSAVPLSLTDNMDWLYEGNGLSIKPLIAFKSGRWTVTALSAVNKSKIRNIEKLDMMAIYSRINGYGAVSQHQGLGITDEDNSTVLYIITEGDLANSLRIGG